MSTPFPDHRTLPSDPSSRFSSEAVARWMLGFILAVAAILRLYHLECPAMWWDEILVPLTAAHPVRYILDFSRHCEMHPPLYHLCIKAVLAVGKSEAVLRLPSVTAGLAGIWLLYRLTRSLADDGTALLAAALLAWQLAMVALSRQVRPYTLFLLVFLFSLFLAQRFFETNGKKGLTLLVLANAILVFLHYVAIIIIPFQVLTLIVFWILNKRPNRVRLLAYVLATGGVFLTVAPFFVSLMTRDKSNFVNLASRMDVLRRLCGILEGFVAPGNNLVGLVGVLVLIGLGIVILWRRNSMSCALLLAVTILPLAVLVAARDNYILYWHIAFVVPVMILFVALGLSWFLPGRMARILGAVVILLAGTAWVFAARGPTLFANDVSALLARNVARVLPSHLTPGTLLVIPDMGLSNSVAWYADQYRFPNPVRRQEYAASETGRSYLMLATPSFFAKDEGLPGLPEPSSPDAPPVPGCLAVRGKIHPQGPFVARGDHRLFSFSMAPQRFYNEVDSLRDVTVSRGLSYQAVATANDVPSSFAYRFQNNLEGSGPVFVSVKRQNQGEGDGLSLRASLDGGPARLLASERGPTGGEFLNTRLDPSAPFHELLLTIGMQVARNTAAYPGGNLDLTAVQAVTVYFAEPGLLFDLLRPVTMPGMLRLRGIEGLERDAGHAWRWALGPIASAVFDSDTARPAILHLTFSNPIPDQGVRVRLNGKTVADLTGLPFSRWMENPQIIEVPLALTAGANHIELVFSRYARNPNDPTATFAATDPRHLAVAITEFSLRARSGTTPTP